MSNNSLNDNANGERDYDPSEPDHFGCDYLKGSLIVLVIGASGDLAKKMTYPSLFSLYDCHYLPKNVTIVGYARSEKEDDEFRKSIREHLKGDDDSKKDEFLEKCIYRNGESYDDADSLEKIFKEVKENEADSNANRLFYFAVPPTVFVSAAGALKKVAMSENGWNRFIIEKPFGKDLESYEEMSSKISGIIDEQDTFRIDHYLGKEMMQNLLVLRFSNATFEPLWNRNHVECVIISLKENFGTQGRGGYFDEYGVIRDMMQNHMLQMLTMVAMEPPTKAAGNFIRDEKVKVLEAIPPIELEECVLGQYIADKDGKIGNYTDDEGVPDDSKTATFATFVMRVNNPRWEGVPFILRCGKALNEKKADVRLQFKSPGGMGALFPDSPVPRNELVMKFQPGEAIYMKTNVKTPGLAGDPIQSELDLSYRTSFEDKAKKLPDAYTRLILQVMRGDKSMFVRDDELREAWRIFTPLLHKIEEEGVKPIPYEGFTRGPKESDELVKKYGFSYMKGAYHWEPKTSSKM
eukprot:Plantae.Rhodophyta-Hildenbrandia_rubra.ctg4456.p1 GENE.Plantae.Rhodophyta-Hildenbrandia_rubra.ctg4456~~Plantae.Rhodophyta-Hildenbrandia_rubra.ctg4456.p1  ORF type:complete len:521 (-),score=110.42 Plantae.Rhodophyta-Hildenbrandia_rubra.ctg4456:2539-4101(-)